MPDLDRVERKLPKAWRAPYELIRGGQPDEAVARAVLCALTKFLREEGGAPRLPELAEILRERDAGLIDTRSLSRMAFRLEHEMTTRPGKLVAAALMRPEVSGSQSCLLGPPDRRIALSFLKRTIESILFSQQRDYLIGRRFGSRQEALHYESRLLSLLEPQLEKLAKRLAKRPSGRKLRAPSIPRLRKSTRELLDQPV